MTSGKKPFNYINSTFISTRCGPNKLIMKNIRFFYFLFFLLYVKNIRIDRLVTTGLHMLKLIRKHFDMP